MDNSIQFDRQIYRNLYFKLKALGFFERSNAHGFFVTFIEICLWVGLVATISQGISSNVLYWLLQFCLGLSLYRCFVLVHECGHDALFKSSFLNRVFAELMGALSFIPATNWRLVHNQHHKWVGIVDKDPTSEGTLKFKKSAPGVRLGYRFLWVLHIPIAALTGIWIFWQLPFKQYRFRHLRQQLSSIFSIFFVLVFHCGLVFLLGWPTYSLIFLPAIFIYLVVFEMINLCHHAGLYALNSEMQSKSIPCYAQAPYCRTTLMPSWLSMFLCYHFTLHSEHHLFPQVPWRKLPHLQRLLAQQPPEQYQTVSLLSYWLNIRSADPFELFIDSVPALKKQSSN